VVLIGVAIIIGVINSNQHQTDAQDAAAARVAALTPEQRAQETPDRKKRDDQITAGAKGLDFVRPQALSGAAAGVDLML
jgi:predicted aspartyl protease